MKKENFCEYYAHSLKNQPSKEWHKLDEHLKSVAKKAEEFANFFSSGDWAYLAGLWHDLGKYLTEWQDYLKRATSQEDIVRPSVNHSTVGAVVSLSKFKQFPAGKILSYIVAGHHTGLPDWYQDVSGRGLVNRVFQNNTLDLRELQQIEKISEVKEKIEVSLPQSAPLKISNQEERNGYSEHFHLWIRMLFSCLVDADFLDTESFMSPQQAQERGHYPSLKELSDRFNSFMERKLKNVLDTPINRSRKNIYNQCKEKGNLPSGIYSLTVPTGGGKTLSSMAFALTHAIKYKKKRIIVAIPYTSIIEQNAKVYKYGTDDEKEIKEAKKQKNFLFGEDAVLEHHSNIDPDKETYQNKLAMENWDAPIIVTTNVQLFESLLASKTSLCRKLHNISNSVIILDEAQMLPPEYLKPILSVLQGLVNHFGVTLIICTATQPVFVGNIGRRQARFEGLKDVKEIMENHNELDEVFHRVKISIPDDLTERKEWKDIAEELTEYKQVLCVVNTRQDCRDLHSLMPIETVHLSANMCGEERSEVIFDVKSRLKEGKEIRVISTQLVEAGVDIDFPVVYRALTGIDSIAQSAGRCNREGKLNLKNQLGQVLVFQPPKSSPVGLLRKGEDATKSVFNMGLENWNTELYSKYFKFFYSSINNFDKPKFYDRLIRENNEFNFQFRTFAQDVKLIDDTTHKGIIVWYKGRERGSFELIEYLGKNGPNFKLIRQLQRFVVNVPLRLFDQLAREEYIEEIHGYWVQKCDGLYKPGIGLLSDTTKWNKELFIV